MSKADRLHLLTTLFNLKTLNEIYKANEWDLYHPVIGVNSRIVPSFLKKKKVLLVMYIFILSFSSPIWVLWLFIKAVYYKGVNNYINYKGERIFLLASSALPRVVNNAGIKEGEDDKWLEVPWLSYVESKGKNIITVFHLVTFKDIWSSYVDSVIVVFYSLFRKGYRYVLPMLISFRWLLYKKAICRIPNNVELVFANQIDSFATLFGRLPHYNKTLVQHGSEIVLENPLNIGTDLYQYHKQYGFWSYKLPVRYKDVTRVYCFTEKERIAMSSDVLNCDPEVYYVGYSLKQFNENLAGDKAILIVGYYSLFNKKEEELITFFQGSGIKIYLKNHPVFPSSVYNQMRDKLVFELLDGPRFPKVDYVFSYGSTLALEYENLGARVILYNYMDENKLRSTLEEVINSLQ